MIENIMDIALIKIDVDNKELTVERAYEQMPIGVQFKQEPLYTKAELIGIAMVNRSKDLLEMSLEDLQKLALKI
jgi:hypothetical protein